MRINSLLTGMIVVTALLSLRLVAASDAPQKDVKVEPAKVVDGVRSVPAYPVLWPEMPAGPNKDVYLNNCVTCHSQLYVLMQPPFSRKVWTAEVEKMKKTYGAAIDDKVMPQIVDYLVSIRGVHGQ